MSNPARLATDTVPVPVVQQLGGQGFQPASTVQDEKANSRPNVEHIDSLGREEDEKPATDDVIPVSPYSNLGIMETLKTFKKSAFLCLCVLFIACSDGYQYSLPGSLAAESSFIEHFGVDTPTGKRMNAQHLAAWNGTYQGFYIIGLLLAGYPADYLGRRGTMALLVFLMACGCVVEMLARDWVVWLTSKIFAGLSIGLCQMCMSTYVSECAPTPIRGMLLVGYSFFWSTGQLITAIASYALQATYSGETRQYLRVIYSQWGFTAISVAIILAIPESPRWLLRKGKREKAVKALRRFNGGVSGYDVEHELNVMVYELTGELHKAAESASVSYLDIFRGSNLRRTFVSSSILCWQQCIGIPIVFGNAAILFREAGLSNPFIGTLIINLLGIITKFFSGYLVERIGRRPLLNVSGCMMVILLVIIGGLGFLSSGTIAGGITIGMMCLWVVAYGTSAGPCGYLLLGESSTLRLRAKTTGFAAAMSGVFGLIFNYSTPLMILPTGGGAGWGLKTSFFYAGTGFIGLVLVYFFVPEHRGRSYAELDELYNSKISARKFKGTVTEAQRIREAEQNESTV